MMFLLGGMSLPMYSLCIAHTNDYLTPKQMVAASGTLMLVGGAGAVLGPIAVSLLMRQMGPGGFFACVAAVHTAIGLFALYRMTRRAPRSEDHTSELQSLMRISYAVFCLQKKQINT